MCVFKEIIKAKSFLIKTETIIFHKQFCVFLRINTIKFA